MPPARFIPIAEETGLILPIGDRVLRTACAQVKAWLDAGLPPVRVAVNLSVRQFGREHLLQSISGALTSSGLGPRFLELEVTESLLMQNAETVVETLRMLKAMGIGLSIDDFGIGYSSLGYLQRFPVDRLKIDKSFVHDIDADAGNALIVTAVTSLGRSLHLRIVAEGVETAAQMSFARERGCHEAQGFLLCRPRPAAEIPAWGVRDAVP